MTSILALGLLVLWGCSDDEESATEFCRVLSEPPAGSRWSDADFIIFVDPEATERDVAAVRAELDHHDDVAESTWVSQEQAYEEFLEQFVGRPEVTDGVRPETLPPSFRVRTAGRDQDSIRATAEHFEHRTGVYRVVHHAGQKMSVIDWHVRPLTSPLSSTLLAFTLGRAGIDLSGVAPTEAREHALALEALWAEPWSASEPVQEAAVDAARQIAAFYDTECP